MCDIPAVTSENNPPLCPTVATLLKCQLSVQCVSLTGCSERLQLTAGWYYKLHAGETLNKWYSPLVELLLWTNLILQTAAAAQLGPADSRIHTLTAHYLTIYTMVFFEPSLCSQTKFFFCHITEIFPLISGTLYLKLYWVNCLHFFSRSMKLCLLDGVVSRGWTILYTFLIVIRVEVVQCFTVFVCYCIYSWSSCLSYLH